MLSLPPYAGEEVVIYHNQKLGMLKNACKASVEKLRQPLSIERILLKALLLLNSFLNFFLNPLHLNISMYILHTVLQTFPTALTRRFK